MIFGIPAIIIIAALLPLIILVIVLVSRWKSSKPTVLPTVPAQSPAISPPTPMVTTRRPRPIIGIALVILLVMIGVFIFRPQISNMWHRLTDENIAISPVDSGAEGDSSITENGRQQVQVKTVGINIHASRAGYFFDLVLESIEMDSEHTIVTVSWSNPRSPRENASVNTTTVLKDDNNNIYPIQSVEGVPLGGMMKLNYGQTIRARLFFPPLKENPTVIQLDLEDLWRNGPFTACTKVSH